MRRYRLLIGMWIGAMHAVKTSLDNDESLTGYLEQGWLMQIATLSGDQPWVCTVYYVADDQMNLYWLSLPTRRHSMEIAAHNKVAVAIAVKHDQPIIGIQAEGITTVVQDEITVKHVLGKYITKYDMGNDFFSSFIKGTNQHRLYKFAPQSLVLLDEAHAKEKGRQEWDLVS